MLELTSHVVFRSDNIPLTGDGGGFGSDVPHRLRRFEL
jgi:hypothetical protein